MIAIPPIRPMKLAFVTGTTTAGVGLFAAHPEWSQNDSSHLAGVVNGAAVGVVSGLLLWQTGKHIKTTRALGVPPGSLGRLSRQIPGSVPDEFAPLRQQTLDALNTLRANTHPFQGFLSYQHVDGAQVGRLRSNVHLLKTVSQPTRPLRT